MNSNGKIRSKTCNAFRKPPTQSFGTAKIAAYTALKAMWAPVSPPLPNLQTVATSANLISRRHYQKRISFFTTVAKSYSTKVLSSEFFCKRFKSSLHFNKLLSSSLFLLSEEQFPLVLLRGLEKNLRKNRSLPILERE